MGSRPEDLSAGGGLGPPDRPKKLQVATQKHLICSGASPLWGRLGSLWGTLGPSSGIPGAVLGAHEGSERQPQEGHKRAQEGPKKPKTQ